MADARPHIVIASQEVWPFVPGGGIGRHVAEAAVLLADTADVTILTDARWSSAHARLAAERDPRLPDGVRYAWVEETPADTTPFHSGFHYWSHSCWRALRDLARQSPVDLVEFEDFRGIGAVAIDAKRTGAPELAETTLAVRLHTSWEMTAVLNRQTRDDLASRSVMALERLSLRFADRLIHPGERTYDAYKRFYGAEALAQRTIVPTAFLLPDPPGTDLPAPRATELLRLLYVGRLEERKGVVALLRGILALGDADVELTLVGRDTPTAPGGGSMQGYLERLANGDPRVRFHGSADREELDALIDAHHVVVVPSRWESYGYVVREALARNRPVVATPVGGIVDGFAVGRSGWLTRDASTEALAAALAELAGRRDEVEALITQGAPRASLEEALDVESISERYRALAGTRRSRVAPPVPPDAPGPVTAVVLALRGGGSLGKTLAALEAQDDVELEIVVVADDPPRVPAGELARLHGLVMVPPGAGPAAALRAALASRAGAGPVVLLCAGGAPAPSFTKCGIAALAAPAAPAYVTAYGAGRDPANAPLGNAVADLLADFAVSGEVVVLSPAALTEGFPAASDEGDHAVLFRDLAARGRYGAVIPEPLIGPVRSHSREASPSARAMTLVAGGHDLWTEQ